MPEIVLINKLNLEKKLLTQYIFDSNMYSLFLLSFANFVGLQLKKSKIKGGPRDLKIKGVSSNIHPEISYLGTVTGQRGKPKLVLDGYTFIQNKRIDEKTYWCCSQIRQKNCKARVITVGSIENFSIKCSKHSHDREIYLE